MASPYGDPNESADLNGGFNLTPRPYSAAERQTQRVREPQKPKFEDGKLKDVFEKLWDLQDILAEKLTLEKEIQEMPKLLNDQEEVVSRLKKTFIDKNQEYERAKLSEGDFRNLLAQAESDREKSEKNMDAISTQREYEALDKEIRDAAEKEQQHRKDVQREERNAAELDEQIKQLTALIEQQEKDNAERQAGIEAEIREKESQVADLKQQEQTLNQGLDPELLFKFERIVQNNNKKESGDRRGIVAIKGGVCTGCHMILPAQFANMVRKMEESVFCPYCSRILFYEDAEQGEEEFFDNDDAGSLADLDDMDYDEDDEDDEEEEKVNIDFEE